ncbi:MAG: glycosyltransferase family 4 protein [Ignavibacteriae bacterium]|nr:glycosyltransferase family 4 protein [Ignavibacteriota bacterium]
MRILLLNQYYWPDISGNAQYGTQLAEDLAAAGMEVHAIASRGDYLGERTEPLPAEEVRNGVFIHRVPVTNFGKRRPWTRLADALSFHIMAFLRAMRLARPDVIITQTAPLLIGVPAALLATLRRARLVVWCQDVWPDIAFALNLFRTKSYSGRLFRVVARAAMRRADRVAAIGRCMQTYLVQHAGLDERAVVYHPNWSDSRDLRPVAPELNQFRKAHGLNGAFVVLYSGNMGWGHPFESIMEAARRLRDRRDIRFLFIGGGQRRQYIEDTIRDAALDTALLLPYQPLDVLSESLSAGDLHLVSLDPRLDGLIVPSKFYGALAVGRPVLFVGSPNNEIARVIDEAGCGQRVDPDDPDALTEAIRAAADTPDLWASMGGRARDAYTTLYTRESGTARYAELLRALSPGR